MHEAAGLVAVDIEVGLELLESEADQELLVRGVEHRLELTQRELEGEVLLAAGEGLGDDKSNLGAWGEGKQNSRILDFR